MPNTTAAPKSRKRFGNDDMMYPSSANRCRTVSSRAWYPPHRRKKSFSIDVARNASRLPMPKAVRPANLDCSWSIPRFWSMRRLLRTRVNTALTTASNKTTTASTGS